MHPLVRDDELDPSRLAAARIAIEAVQPQVPDGAFAVKRLVGERVTVSADIIADGHDVLAAELLWRADDETEWQPCRRCDPMANDRWEASFVPARIGRHRFTVQAWWDAWETFRHDLSAKHAAGQTVTLEIEEGCRMIEAAAERAPACSANAVIATPASLDAARRSRCCWPRTPRRRCMRPIDRPFAAEHAPADARSMPIARRPPSPAGMRCFPAPPRTIRRGTARSPM